MTSVEIVLEDDHKITVTTGGQEFDLVQSNDDPSEYKTSKEQRSELSESQVESLRQKLSDRGYTLSFV